jgi:hypothetical protein
MARIEKALIAAALALVVVSLSAQPRQDFSGRWLAVPDAPPVAPNTPPPAAGFGSGLGPDITITQTAAAMTIERAQFSPYDIQPPMRFVYALDGTESRNAVNMGRGPQETTSRVAWQNGALQLTTTYRFPDPGTGKPASSELRQVFTLEAADTLVVSATRTGPGVGPVTTSRQTFKKK